MKPKSFACCELVKAGAAVESYPKKLEWTNDAINAYQQHLVNAASRVCASCRLITVCKPQINQSGVITKI